MIHRASRAIKTAAAAAAFIAMTLPQAASAATVFQSVADLTDTSQHTAAWCSGCGGTYRVFDQFTLSSSETITGFSVALYSLVPYWGNGMNFSIWSANGSLPDTQLFSQNLADADFTTQTLNSVSLLATTDDVVGLTLGAGTYYVSFYSDNLGVYGYNGGGGNLYQQGNMHHVGTSAGFTLVNDAVSNNVPEPATLALFCIALLGAVGASRRRG